MKLYGEIVRNMLTRIKIGNNHSDTCTNTVCLNTSVLRDSEKTVDIIQIKKYGI